MRKLSLLLFVIALVWGMPTGLWAAGKPSISFDDLKKQLMAGETVKGKTIHGDAIIRFIKETAALEKPPAVSLENCVVEKGLDFTQLERVPIEKVKLPGEWDEEKRWVFKAKYKQARVVKNEIKISKCEIKAGIQSEKEPYSIYATGLKNWLYTPLFFYGRTDFQYTKFNGKANFTSASFGGHANFRSASFNDEAFFNITSFSIMADFGSASFSRKTNFGLARFYGVAYFHMTSFNGEVNLSLAIFSKDAYFNKANFNGKEHVGFILASFGGSAYFDAARFSGDIYFGATRFSSITDFSEARFSSKADFILASFSSNANFRSACFCGETGFVKACFENKAIFKLAVFNGNTNFWKAIFSDYADFRSASFSGDAGFRSASFGGGTDFRSSSFSGDTDFSYTIFENAADFKESYIYRLVLRVPNFKSYADFRRAEIRQLDFNNATNPSIISGRMDFRKAKISASHFQDVIFQKDADFSDAQFGYNREKDPNFIGPPRPDSAYKPHDFSSVFRYVTFESDTYFTRTRFHDAVAFERTNFKKEANFKEADFNRKNDKSRFSFSYLNFNKLLINWNQLPKIERWVTSSDERIRSFSNAETEAKAKKKNKTIPTPEKPEPISQVLKGLEENFRAHKQLDDANAAHFHRKKAALEELRSGKRQGSRLWPKTEWIIWGLACGYGTKILWALGWSFLFVTLFALLYKKDVRRIRPSHAELAEQTRQDHTVKQRIFEWPWLYVENNRTRPGFFARFEKFINAMRFSVVIFFKFGPRDTTISGRFWRIDYLYIIWLEWLLGFYMLACMFYTLSNSLPLLNQLIRGLF